MDFRDTQAEASGDNVATIVETPAAPKAKSKGVKCVVNCDAHRHEHAGFLRLGAGIARKGWLTPAQVLNTRPLAEVRRWLGR